MTIKINKLAIKKRHAESKATHKKLLKALRNKEMFSVTFISLHNDYWNLTIDFQGKGQGRLSDYIQYEHIYMEDFVPKGTLYDEKYYMDKILGAKYSWAEAGRIGFQI